ncbi:MAG TPA: hypothetical protein VKE97_08310 [Acidimicrobiia bacterium]|nr:hypothetical protein [Acidimicrobiia bacterium]
MTGVASRRLRGIVVGILVGAAASACSSGSGGGSSNTHELPPNDKASIERVFAPALDRLGVRLTRGALVDLKTGKPSPNGTHLAVYVEPTGNFSSEDYARGTVATLRAFIPAAFERWGGLTSFDLCQEPLPAVDARPEPPPVTKVDLTKAASRKVKWDDLDLVGLLRDANRLGSRALSVYAKPDVRLTSYYQDATMKANTNSTAGTTGASSTAPASPSYDR